MSDRSLVDPELLPFLEAFPSFTFSNEALPAIREGVAMMQAAIPVVQGELQPDVRFVPGPQGAPDVRLLIWRPFGETATLPALFHMHGGGFIVGSPDMLAPQHRKMTAELNCVIVSVDYRLAPEAPHPAPIEDCYAALKWVYANAGNLSIDPERIGVGGESAGGGLAAALALLARDRGEIPLRFQHLMYPMLDDRTGTSWDPHPFTGDYIWTAQSNQFAWASLLGHAPGGDNVGAYAAAARAADLSSLPATFLAVGALDLFLDEDLAYGLRLTRAGVPVELHVYPGAYHSFNDAGDARVVSDVTRDSRAALARFLAR